MPSLVAMLNSAWRCCSICFGGGAPGRCCAWDRVILGSVGCDASRVERGLERIPPNRPGASWGLAASVGKVHTNRKRVPMACGTAAGDARRRQTADGQTTDVGDSRVSIRNLIVLVKKRANRTASSGRGRRPAAARTYRGPAVVNKRAPGMLCKWWVLHALTALALQARGKGYNLASNSAITYSWHLKLLRKSI